jgi:hypothetical protein
VKVLDDILKLDFDIVIPGHGRLLTKENVRSDRQKLAAMNQRMTDLVRKGVPKEKVFDGLRLGDQKQCRPSGLPDTAGLKPALL